jgi:GNAT superfamily N-acetyltransferase
MAAAALAISRIRPALTWRALDGDLVAGEVSARLRPDDRCFVYFDTWRADACPPLADAVARDLGRDLYATLEDAEYDALEACAQAGFAVHRRESYYRIPTDPAVTGLAGAVLPAGLEVLSAADADLTRLRLLDDALRQDVPGYSGWRWDAEEFRAETFGSFFDPATYLVAADRADGAYAGLVRIWRTRAGPRLGLIAMLAPYRRRGAARALLGQAFAVLAARGATSVTGQADDTSAVSVSLLTALGARRYGGTVELIRRWPGRPAPYGQELVQAGPDWMFCAAPPGHLVVRTSETAVLPWTHDRMGQPAARAAAARHRAGLGSRLPVRRVRERIPAFRFRAGGAGTAEASCSAGTPQARCRHPRPAGTGG